MKCRDDVITSVNGVPFPEYDKDNCNFDLGMRLSGTLNIFKYECINCDYTPEDSYTHLMAALACLGKDQAHPFLDAVFDTFSDEYALASESTLQISFKSGEAAPIPDMDFQVGDFIYDAVQDVHGFIVADPVKPDWAKEASLVIQVAPDDKPSWVDPNYIPYIHVAPENPKYMYVAPDSSTLVHRNA